MRHRPPRRLLHGQVGLFVEDVVRFVAAHGPVPSDPVGDCGASGFGVVDPAADKKFGVAADCRALERERTVVDEPATYDVRFVAADGRVGEPTAPPELCFRWP